MLNQQLQDDLKAAMLAGETHRVETLRGLKSVISYAAIAANKRDIGLTDDEILPLLAKEAKKRQESADLFVQGGAQDRADKELSEKTIIESYLPAQIDDNELKQVINEAVNELNATGPQDMGKVIGAVKAKTGASADGSKIARFAKERLSA